MNSYRDLFRHLTILLFCAVFLTTSLIVETTSSNYIDIRPNHIAEFKTDIQNFEFVLPQSNTQQIPQSKFLYTFPKKLKSNQELSIINFFDETNYIMDTNTELEFLVAKNQEQRLHSVLRNGTLILDNRLANSSIQTIQVGNTFLKPFTNGIYVISNINGNISLGAIQGSFSLGIYDENGSLANTLLIHRSQEVNFNTFVNQESLQVGTLSSRNFIDKFRFSSQYSLDSEVSTGDLFKLSRKGKTYTPTQSQSFLASLDALNFNQNKQNFINIYPFYRSLENAKQEILINNSQNLNQYLVEARLHYSNVLSDNPESFSLLAKTANDNLNLLTGLNPESSLNSLKIFLGDLFGNELSQNTALKLSLSLFEDINYGYDNKKPDISVRSEQVLAKVVSANTLKDSTLADLTSLLVVLDNILETFDQSFSLEILQTREVITTLIKDQTEDPIFIQEIEARKLNYFQKVITLGQEGVIDKAKAKRITFFIADTLPSDLQQQYRNQINQLD